MVLEILLWGVVIGIIHFIVVGFLYQNPMVAKQYEQAKAHPAMKQWPNPKKYIFSMALGTQVEVFILTGAYLFLRTFFTNPDSWSTALILGALFAGIRVYPRFWNMWIQSSYPNRLLMIEFVNGILGTFIIITGLKLLPV